MIAHAGKLWVMGCSASLWLASPSWRLQGQSYHNVCDSKLITHNSKLKSRKRESLTEFCFRMTLPSVLSPVSHLFYKCIGLCPYPYFSDKHNTHFGEVVFYSVSNRGNSECFAWGYGFIAKMAAELLESRLIKSRFGRRLWYEINVFYLFVVAERS